MGGLGRVLGVVWGSLVGSLGGLEGVLEGLGAVLGGLGAVLGGLGAVLGRLWGRAGPYKRSNPVVQGA